MFLYRATVFLICNLVVLTAAEPVCDPDTQYLLHGECCQKCRPGTSMESEECRSPKCTECGKDEYTDKYNTEVTCERQPYCGPNLNFHIPESTSKTQRHTCLCREGFHCSSHSCINCVPHTECAPGFGAKIIGGQTQDTQCEKCPNETFSDETSWNGTCKKMTVCGLGFEPQGGSSECDRICVFGRRHIGVICALLILSVVVTGGIFLYRRKNKTGHKLQEVCSDENMNPQNQCKHPEEEEEEEKKTPFITNPSDDTEMPHFLGQETDSKPEENEYSIPTIGTTKNGLPLSQDNKEHKISIPDTQGMNSELSSELNSEFDLI